MIETPDHLAATQDFLRSMEEGLASLRAKLLPGFPERLAVLAASYVEEIARLRGEIDRYLEIEQAALRNADLIVDLKGVVLGTAPVSAVAGVMDGFRRSVLTLASVLEGRATITGRRGQRFEAASDFRLLAVAPGSVRLALGLPSSTQLDLYPTQDIGARAAGLYVKVAQWAASDAPASALIAEVERTLPVPVDSNQREIQPSLVAWQVFKTLPPAGGAITSLTLSGKLTEGRPITLHEFSRARLQEVVVAGGRVVRDYAAEGVIRALDLDAGTFRLRTAQRRLRCLFEPLRQEHHVARHAGLRVRVTGELVLDAITGAPKHLLADKIEDLGQGSSRNPSSG